MSQLNSLPSPERRVPVVSVSLFVHVLVRCVLEPFYLLGRKTARRVGRTVARGWQGRCEGCGRQKEPPVSGGRGVRLLSHLWDMPGQSGVQFCKVGWGRIRHPRSFLLPSAS